MKLTENVETVDKCGKLYKTPCLAATGEHPVQKAVCPASLLLLAAVANPCTGCFQSPNCSNSTDQATSSRKATT